jgi:DNA-binding MarR family transcriptional regulator
MTDLSLPSLPCMCASFRRCSRALTQLYEKELRPLGLRATQLTILQVLSRAGEITQGKLGEFLAMDSTSLTRTLAIMIHRGWITERRGEDKRERWLRLNSAGESQLKRVEPLWEQVQSRLRRQLGTDNWNHFLELTQQLTSIAMMQGGSL